MVKKKFNFFSTYQEVINKVLLIKEFHVLNNLRAEDIAELEIILVEALNNIVKHSYKENPDGRIEIEISIFENLWECRLIDSGISRNNFEVPNLEFDPTDIQNLPESGMGLFLINKLTDSNKYKIYDSHNEFILTKMLRN